MRDFLNKTLFILLFMILSVACASKHKEQEQKARELIQKLRDARDKKKKNEEGEFLLVPLPPKLD